MNPSHEPGISIVVILDPEYGTRLCTLPAGQPIWVILSPTNEPVVRSLWKIRPDRGSVDGITGFRYVDGATAENTFLANLDTIDLHHGPYSTDNPYTGLEVIGVRLTNEIRAALSTIGFTSYSETKSGFGATRSSDKARELRQ